MSHYFEPPSVSLALPPAVAGDLIVGRADGSFDRLALGANGTILNVSAGAIRWGNIIDTGGLTITAGDFQVSAGKIIIGPNAVTGMLMASAVDFVFANAANTLANFRLTDAGVATIRGGLTITAGDFQVSAGKIIIGPNATTGMLMASAVDFVFANAANTLANFRLTDAGVATIRGGLTITAGGLTVTAGGVSFGGAINTYNNVATAGLGVAAVYGYGRPAAGQTAAVANVASYALGAADGSFIVSANVLVTTSTTHNFTVTVAYTDESNTARTLTLTFSQVTGTLLQGITNVTGAGAYEGVPLHIRVKASTTIIIATVGTFTIVTYNVEGAIVQIA